MNLTLLSMRYDIDLKVMVRQVVEIQMVNKYDIDLKVMVRQVVEIQMVKKDMIKLTKVLFMVQ